MADIRHIEEKDQLQLANIIRSVFEEYGAPLVNTVYGDPRTEHVFDLLAGKNAGYWVAADNGIVLGGCGYYPTEGLPEGSICRLQPVASAMAQSCSTRQSKGLARLAIVICISNRSHSSPMQCPCTSAMDSGIFLSVLATQGIPQPLYLWPRISFRFVLVGKRLFGWMIVTLLTVLGAYGQSPQPTDTVAGGECFVEGWTGEDQRAG